MVKKLKFLAVISFIMIFAVSLVKDSEARTYRFSGGPSGGVYQYFASAISTLAKNAGYNVLASSSGGAIENVRLVHSGKADFGVCNSGDIFTGREGKFINDTTKYDNVYAIAFLYGAAAQLVVRADSGIKSAKQLAGKKVGLGNPGSGAAASAELFFKEIGIWDKIQKEFLGYREAADAFKNKQLDAFWVFAGYPNAAIIEAALQNKIELVDVYNDAEQAGMIKKYPYLAKEIIPANTYSGQTKDVISYQDSVIWITNKEVPEDVVYNLLKTVFSKEGLAHMVSVHKAAAEMSVASGIKGIVTPLHPGAIKFWTEMGVIKEDKKPKKK